MYLLYTISKEKTSKIYMNSQPNFFFVSDSVPKIIFDRNAKQRIWQFFSIFNKF